MVIIFPEILNFRKIYNPTCHGDDNTTNSTNSNNEIAEKLTDKVATCGVVIMTAPETFAELSRLIVDRCSSDVPGGVSTMR